MKKTLPIFLFGFLSLLLLFPAAAAAIAASAPVNMDGAQFYSFPLDCHSPAAFDTNHGIIIPSGADRIDAVYLYFHGKKDDVAHIDIKDLAGRYKLGEKIQSMSERGQNIALIIPQLNPASGDHWTSYNKTNFDCFINGSIQQLKTTVSSAPNKVATVLGHSGGGGVLKSYFSSGLKADLAIAFDACYGDWCSAMVKNNSNPNIVYYIPNTKTQADAENALKNDRDNKTALYSVQTSHTDVPTACFLNHLVNNDCGGKASLKGGAPIDEQPYAESTAIEDELKFSAPKLSINIPHLNFSEITQKISSEGNSYIFLPWIGQYISAIYKFAMVVASIIAVIVIIMQGARVIISAGGEEKNAAFKRILQAVIGLFICWGSYAILYNINPDLVEFKSLKVLYIKGEPIGQEIDQEVSLDQDSPSDSAQRPDTQLELPEGVNLCFPVETGSLKNFLKNWGDERSRNSSKEEKAALATLEGEARKQAQTELDKKLKGSRCHAGVDLLTKEGSNGNVYAMADGKITAIITGFYRCKDGWGNKNRGADGVKPNERSVAVMIYHESIKATINYSEIDPTAETMQRLKELQANPNGVTKGALLGKATYCGMLHIEACGGIASRNLQWFPPSGQSSAGSRNKCQMSFLSSKPATLLNPTNLLTKIQNQPCK